MNWKKEDRIEDSVVEIEEDTEVLLLEELFIDSKQNGIFTSLKEEETGLGRQVA